MPNRLIILPIILLAAVFSAQNVHAEIAILCGDIAAIEKNEKAAIVHVDFTHQPVRSKADVKFLTTKGVDQVVVSAKAVGLESVEVKSANETYVFDGVDTCEDEGSVSVQVKAGRLDCNCYSD